MHSCISLLQRDHLDGDHLSSLFLFVRKISFTEHARFHCSCVSSGFVSVPTRISEWRLLSLDWMGQGQKQTTFSVTSSNPSTLQQKQTLHSFITCVLRAELVLAAHVHMYGGYTVWFQALEKWLRTNQMGTPVLQELPFREESFHTSAFMLFYLKIN